MGDFQAFFVYSPGARPGKPGVRRKADIQSERLKMATFDFITADDHTALADDAKAGYEAFGEGFRKSVELPDISVLEGTLAKQKNDIKALTATAAEAAANLAKYDGIDPEAYAAIVAEKEAADKAIADAAEKARLDAMDASTREAEIQRKAEADLLALRTEAANREKTATANEAALKLKLDEMKLDAVALSAIRESGVLSGSEDDVLFLSRKHIGRGENGEVVVFDDSGLPTEATPAEFYKTTFKEKKPMFFKPLQSGGGSDPDTGGRGQNSDDLMKLPPTERLNAARAKQ